MANLKINVGFDEHFITNFSLFFLFISTNLLGIMNNQEKVNVDSLNCIICCENKKSVLLLPCRHQHTCEACWSMWRMQCMEKAGEKSFSESEDDNAFKPTCPVCVSFVDTGIDALN